MKKRLRRGADSAEVNMTPMLDIVFILLIFFIVTSTILQEEGLQMIAPPPDETEVDQEMAESILVQIDQRNRIFVNGRLTDRARVTAAVQRANVDSGGRGAVVIQPDPDSEHGVVTGVYDSSRAAGLAGPPGAAGPPGLGPRLKLVVGGVDVIPLSSSRLPAASCRPWRDRSSLGLRSPRPQAAHP